MLPQKKYTYEDYYKLDDGIRYEVYYGKIYAMSPAPSFIHQSISGGIFRIFSNYLFKSKCKVFSAPFDVIFIDVDKNGNNTDSVVQPDVLIICDKSKFDPRGCVGAPDLIVEVISPGTSKNDTQTKFEIYEKHGVKEYWIVYPNEGNVFVFLLNENGKYDKPKIYAREDKIPVSIFQDLTVDLSEIFEIEEEETNPNEIRI